MTARMGVLLVVVVAVVAAAIFIFTSGDEEPGETTSTTLEAEASPTTSIATTTTTVGASTTVSETVECAPIAGTQVQAVGEIEGYPPQAESEGRLVFGSAAGVWFSLDGPTNRNFVHLALILVGEDVVAWTSLPDYESAELSYDPASSRLTGTIEVRFSDSPEITSDLDAYETSQVDLTYASDTGRLTGTVSHPDMTFDLDLEATEHPMEFFEDVSCYPEPLDVPETPNPAP